MINYGGRMLVCCDRTAAIIGAGVAVAGLTYGVINSENQKAKANEIEKSLKTPVDQIPAEFYQNREIARNMAQVGLPQQQYNNAVGNINQNQAAAISAASGSANPGANITSIVRQGNQAKAQLDAEDAQARQSNQRYFIQENGILGARKDQQEQANVFDPYTRDFNLMQAYRGAGQTTQNNTVNAALGLAGTMANYKANNPSTTATGTGPNAANMITDPNTTTQDSINGLTYVPGISGVPIDPVTGLPYQYNPRQGQYNSFAGGFQ